MSDAPLRVLCLDIEGGYGGSSRSLYETLRHIDHNAIAAEVWCRREGPIKARYEAIGIPCRVTPTMPHMNSLPRLSRNLFGYARLARNFWKASLFRQELSEAIQQRFDLIHFNHEGLCLLATWLRHRHNKPQTMHVRTMIYRNAFGRWQCRRMVTACNTLVFITKNERANVEMMLGHSIDGTVVHNIVSTSECVSFHPAIPMDRRLKVAVLANYSWGRGLDRIIDVAAVLAQRGRQEVLFVMAGEMTLRGSLPGTLGAIARTGGSLADYAAERGVSDMFLFLGHVAEPETVLAACDVLVKPTREANPWGRDILESLAYGKPVVTLGHCNTFVETNVTGYLFEHFDECIFAECLLQLATDRALCRKLGEAGRARIEVLCNGAARGRDVVKIWRAAIA